MNKLITLKEAAVKLSVSYFTLLRFIKRNPEARGLYKLSKTYKIDLSLFKEYISIKQNKDIDKVHFYKLSRYYVEESGYLLTLSEKTRKTHERALELANEYFYRNEFNEENIHRFRGWLLVGKGLGEGTVKKYLDVISKTCEICEKAGLVKYIKRDYLKGLKRKASKRFLTKEERERIRQTANENILDYIEFAIETGLRKEEIFSLKWENVFFEDKKIYIAKRKSNDTLTLRISQEAWNILKKRRKLDQPFKAISYEVYNETLRKAGIDKEANGEKCTFHTLRHTFASWALMGWHSWQKGKPLSVYDIKQLLGHKKINTTERYLHLDTSNLDKIFELES